MLVSHCLAMRSISAAAVYKQPRGGEIAEWSVGDRAKLNWMDPAGTQHLSLLRRHPPGARKVSDDKLPVRGDRGRQSKMTRSSYQRIKARRCSKSARAFAELRRWGGMRAWIGSAGPRQAGSDSTTAPRFARNLARSTSLQA